jgi:hypothetical protein
VVAAAIIAFLVADRERAGGGDLRVDLAHCQFVQTCGFASLRSSATIMARSANSSARLRAGGLRLAMTVISGDE